LNDPHVGSALDDLAAADPLVAHHLAYALHTHDPIAACNALAAASLDETKRLWRLLPETLQHAVLADVLLPWLALRMLIDDDAERREQGMAILAQQPDRAAALLPLLRDDLCTALESVSAIAFACADLPLRSPAPAPVRRGRR
jgi:hypothetical protein